VVVTPVGLITHKGETREISQNQMGPIAKKIRETLVGIQREEIEDPFGWVIPVK